MTAEVVSLNPVVDKVRAVVASHFERAIEDIRADMNLEVDLGADSMDAIEITIDLESDPALVIDDDGRDILTVGDLISITKEKVSR